MNEIYNIDFTSDDLLNPSPDLAPHYSCPACTAGCTFEAMQMCGLPADRCPIIQGLTDGSIVDRRPTDADPEFPSAFTRRGP